MSSPEKPLPLGMGYVTELQTETLRAVVELKGPRMAKLAAWLGVKPASVRDRLAGLQKRGMVEVQGKAWMVTPAGVRALAALSPLAPLPLAVGAVGVFSEHPGWTALMDALALPELRALLRVVLGVAVLRQRAPGLGPMPWVGAYGPPGTGKTTAGEVALHLLGGELFKVGTMTAGEAIGRRVQRGGVWEVDPPRTLSGPVTVLDELGEADQSLERAVFALVDLGPSVRIEGRDFPQAAAIYATWNPEGRDIPLAPGARRRGLLLNTGHAAARLTAAFVRDLAGADVRAVLAQHPGPWFNVQALNVQALPDADTRHAYSALLGALSVQGQQDTPLAALGPLGAAYAVMLGLSPAQALAEVVADAALLAHTRPGLLSPLWKERVGELRAAASLPALEVTPQDTTGGGVAVLEAQAGRAAFQGVLLQRVKNLREPLQGVPDRLMSGAERETCRGYLKALETISERLPHQADLPAVEEFINRTADGVRVFLNALAHRSEMAHTTKADELRAAEKQLEAVRAWRDWWNNRAPHWRTLATTDPEAGMLELEGLGWVTRTQPLPGRTESPGRGGQAEKGAVIATKLALNLLGIWSGVTPSSTASQNTPLPSLWLYGPKFGQQNTGKRIEKTSGDFLRFMSAHARGEVDRLGRRRTALEETVKTLRAELRTLPKVTTEARNALP